MCDLGEVLYHIGFHIVRARRDQRSGLKLVPTNLHRSSDDIFESAGTLVSMIQAHLAGGDPRRPMYKDRRVSELDVVNEFLGQVARLATVAHGD